MAHLKLAECLEPKGGRLERVHYFPRQLLTADDLTADSEYFRTKMRRHNRLLHGWGTVCGLAVIPAPTPELPWRVSIGDGYALGPYGDDIYVAEPVFLDLARCGPGTVTDPCAPDQLRTPGSATGGTIFVAIKYAECLARPVRAMPAGCACDEEACEYSRIRDSFQIECLTELPPSHQPPPGPSLCDLIAGKQLPLCPPCPAESWVVLAQVTLPASPTENIAENQIDNFTLRRQVFSTAVLQEQLIKCCCKEQPTLSADLGIQHQFFPAIIQINTRIPPRFDIVVHNKGPFEARNVIVEDDWPQGIQTFNFVTSQGNWTETTNRPFIAELGTLAPGQTVMLGFTFEFKFITEGHWENTVTVKSDTLDPNTSDNTHVTSGDVIL